MSGSPCDCTARCGDDPWLKDGRARPCEWLARLLARPKVTAVERSTTDPRLVLVRLSHAPTKADLQDISASLQRLLQPPIL